MSTLTSQARPEADWHATAACLEATEHALGMAQMHLHSSNSLGRRELIRTRIREAMDLLASAEKELP